MAEQLPKQELHLVKFRTELALVACPNCRNGFEVSPKYQKYDAACTICHGARFISLIPCVCGRPRRHDVQGLVGFNRDGVPVFCCGRKECGEDMMVKPVEAEELEDHSRRKWRSKKNRKGKHAAAQEPVDVEAEDAKERYDNFYGGQDYGGWQGGS